jgi:hypothetical protein
VTAFVFRSDAVCVLCAGSIHRIVSRGFLWHHVWHRLGLPIAAAFSLVLLIPLVHCYFYLGAVGYVWNISPSSSASPSHGQRGIAIGNQGGIIRLSFDDSPGGPFSVGPSVSRRGPFFWWTMPNEVRWDDFRKTVWSIGYNRRSIAAVGITESTVYFPAWMLIALCGIAPSLWIFWRLRRRQNRSPRGFVIEPNEQREPNEQGRSLLNDPIP